MNLLKQEINCSSCRASTPLKTTMHFDPLLASYTCINCFCKYSKFRQDRLEPILCEIHKSGKRLIVTYYRHYDNLFLFAYKCNKKVIRTMIELMTHYKLKIVNSDVIDFSDKLPYQNLERSDI